MPVADLLLSFSGCEAYWRVRANAYSGRGIEAGRRASVRDNEAAWMSWRDERVSCCGWRRADAMVVGVCGVVVRCRVFVGGEYLLQRHHAVSVYT